MVPERSNHPPREWSDEEIMDLSKAALARIDGPPPDVTVEELVKLRVDIVRTNEELREAIRGQQRLGEAAISAVDSAQDDSERHHFQGFPFLGLW
jgi:hypothetical protein